MKIVSDCFNFVTNMLSYHIKLINVLDTHVYFIYVICLSHSGGAKILVWGEGEHQTKFHT